MSDQPFMPPVQPSKNGFLQKNVWLAALTVAVIVLAVATFVTREDSGSSAPTFDSSAPIEDSQTRNKYDDYYQYVLNSSGMANSENKASVLEFGDFVCGLLDDGFSVGDIIEEMRQYTSGSMFTSEYAAAVLLGATTYLCPEHKILVNDYLN